MPDHPDLFRKCEEFTESREVQEAGLYPYFKPIQSGPGTRVNVDGEEIIMIGSNNYLGLTNNEEVVAAAREAVQKYGTSCTGSRFLNGTLDLHEKLEQELSDFMQMDNSIVFSTGFQTNLGIIPTIVNKNDTVVIDRENHASIYDGCRLSFGRTLKYEHKNMDDLRRVLDHVDDDSGILIVTDGVFSMEGDLAPLPELVEIKNEYNARLMVDDAHSIGVMGENGRGTAEHFGLEDEVDLVMGTFSKSFASLGGFVSGDGEVIDYIKHNARSLIFSASMPPATIEAARKALDIIRSEPERREKLWENTKFMRESFEELGLDTGQSATPIIPIIVGEETKTFSLWKELFKNNVYTNPCVNPAVEPGRCLIRTSYMATHSRDELQQVVDVFEHVGEKFGLIPRDVTTS